MEDVERVFDGTTIKPRRRDAAAHPEDADVQQAHFRADLDSMIKSAVGEDEMHFLPDGTSMVLWTTGKVQRYGAWFGQKGSRCNNADIDDLMQFGVAPVLLLRVQLGAAWMFLWLGVLSLPAIFENVWAWEQAIETGANATLSNDTAIAAAWTELADLVENGFTNTSSFYLMTTLGWRLSSVPHDSVRVQNWLLFAQLVVLLLFLVWVRRKMRDKSWRADWKHVTASDFSVMVSGLKQDASPEFLCNQLISWFTDEFGAGAREPDHQVRLSMGVECADAIALMMRRKAAWVALKEAEARARRKAGADGAAGGAADERVAAAAKALELLDIELKKAGAKARPGSGTAFVTFELPAERNACIEYFWRSDLHQLLETVGLRRRPAKLVDLAERFGTRAGHASAAPASGPGLWRPVALVGVTAARLVRTAGELDEHGRPLGLVEVTAAPEPEDVLWQNLAVPRHRSIFYTSLSIVVVLLLLALSAVIMVVLKDYITDLYEEIERCLSEYAARDASGAAAPAEQCELTNLQESGEFWMQSVTQLMSLVSSLVLVTLNSLIRTLVYAMVEHEYKHTQTLKEKAVFYKMSFAYLVNSVLLLMFVYHREPSTWYNGGGVLNQALLLLVSDLAINSVLVRLLPWYWPLMRFIGRRTAASQARLQQYYRPAPLYLGEMYASIVRTFGLCLFYGPMGPLAYWLGSATMLASYACCKFELFHFKRQPPRMSDELCEGLRQMLSLLVVGHLVVAIIFYANSCEGGCTGAVSLPIVLGFVFYGLYIFVPFKYLSCLARFNNAEREACLSCNFERFQRLFFRPDPERGDANTAAPPRGDRHERYSEVLARAEHVAARRFSRAEEAAAAAAAAAVEAGGARPPTAQRQPTRRDKRDATFVRYDVPVVDASGLSIAEQEKFLRYDFTPEILRVPYHVPRRYNARASESASVEETTRLPELTVQLEPGAGEAKKERGSLGVPVGGVVDGQRQMREVMVARENRDQSI